MLKALSSRACLFGMLALSLSGAALADQPPATGLGQSWPNASDVSSNPNFHAYVFNLGGIEFVQINDLNGNVLGAVGSAGGQFITLPVGVFSQLVVTPQQPAAVTTTATPTAAAATVYQDSATTVTTTALSDGTTQIRAAATGNCSDPAICNSHVTQ